MLAVKIDRDRLEYDIHALLTSFFPGEEVKIASPNSDINGKDELLAAPFMEIVLEESEQRIIFDPKGKEPKSYAIASGRDKQLFKGELYRVLKEETGKSLPWGNLTGIRPAKMVMGMLDQGKGIQEAEWFLKESHFVSKEKAALTVEIAKREQEILKPISGEEGYSLYIGIPFCPTTCLYCSFTSYPAASYRKVMDTYVDCLCREMDYVADALKNKRLDTVYIGGGTPTTLSPQLLDRVISHLKGKFPMENVLEFTVEAGRADSITKEKLQVLKKHGVTRISVNPQTMKEETLRIIGRQHTVSQVKEAFALAREEGFDNINMDIILGLPGEDEEDVVYTIEEIKKLSPDSLTVHSLAVKRASRLGKLLREGEKAASLNTENTVKIAENGARDMGMAPYYLYRQKNMSGNFENVGYAKPGKYGIYNILIMEEVQTIIALGAGSISKRVYSDGRIERCENIKDVSLYIEKTDEMIERKKALLQDIC